MGRDRHADNLAVYSNGSSYCFSCGYYHPGDYKKGSGRHLEASTSDFNRGTGTYPLPSDSETILDPSALVWLKSFGLTMIDVVENGLLWSESRKLLIFPYEGAWQGRYFGTEDKPKWFSKGDLEGLIHGFNLSRATEGIVLVEDIVSAIRIGKLGYPVVPLFCAQLTKLKYSRLLHITNRFIFWLDRDKAVEAHKQSERVIGLGSGAGIVVTDLDPKCLSDSDIVNNLKKYLTSRNK